MIGTIEDMAKLKMESTFGGRLKMAREDLKINQEELAAILEERYGVSIGRSYISELERSWEQNKVPKSDIVAALARALNVNGNWLLLIDDDPSLPGVDDDRAWSETTNSIARLVDGLPETKRIEVLDVVRAMAAHTPSTDENAPSEVAEGGESNRFADLVIRGGNSPKVRQRRTGR